MFLAEPPRSQYDLHFRLFGIPVRVHPLFWLFTLFLGYHGKDTKPVEMLIWVGVVFVSILVHEMGHALAALWHGWPPRITLYSFGGLAIYNPTYRNTRSEILIAAAGPAAGFVFIALIMAAVHAAGHQVSITRDSLLPYWITFAPFTNRNVNMMLSALLQVNILWGLINLLPIFPLDGGRIAQELMIRSNPGDGLQKSLWLSLFTAAGAAVFMGVKFESIFMAVFFGYLAYNSYINLEQLRGRGGGYGPW